MIKRLSTNESGNVAMVNAAIYLIVIITVLYVGLQINQNVIESSSIEVNDSLYQAAQDMDNTTESAYGMASIMPIVLIAVAILASLLGLVYLFR